MRPLSIQAGYRYLNLAGKDGNRDNTIADGPYIGASASQSLPARHLLAAPDFPPRQHPALRYSISHLAGKE